MPVNRTRAPPRPRATRIAPYERIADIDTSQSSTTSSSAPPAAPRQLIPTNVSSSTSSTGVETSANKMTEQDEVMLVQLAVGWAVSRKVSLKVFHEDLAAAYDLHQGRHGAGLTITPAEAKQKLNALEKRWYKEAKLRGSWTDVSNALDMRMTKIRFAEDREDEEREKVVQKAEAARQERIDAEAAKTKALDDMLARIRADMADEDKDEEYNDE